MSNNRCLSCNCHRLICGLQGEKFFESIEFGALSSVLSFVDYEERISLNAIEFGVRS